MRTEDLARIVIARIVADYQSGESYLNPGLRKVHKAALGSLLRNIALELQPRRTNRDDASKDIADLFATAADGCP